MPQKKNADTLELIRAKAAAAVAQHRPGCPHMGPEEAGGAEGAGGAESPASEAAGPKES